MYRVTGTHAGRDFRARLGRAFERFVHPWPTLASWKPDVICVSESTTFDEIANVARLNVDFKGQDILLQDLGWSLLARQVAMSKIDPAPEETILSLLVEDHVPAFSDPSSCT